MIFREKLVNTSTGEVRQGNVLDSSLGEVEQIMIDSSLCSVMYYWVKTPDSTWRKTQYYELVENLYSIIYKVNDSIYQTYYLQEGDDVPVPDYTPATGYTWSGWLNENIPAKMPASDIVVESYTEQTDYAIIYYIDGRVVYSETHHYNDSITAYVPETREHYVFSGWSGFPQSGYMPAENVTVIGTYEEDLSYVLSYFVDASVYTQQSYMSNDVIDAPDDPQVEEGYSWSGWIDLPSLMPAYDSSVHSTLTANQYILDYYVDSSLWNSLIYNYKQTIVPLTYTPAEGYIFSGWVNEPETMPAINHYRVDGMTQLNLYNVYWYIDSSLIQTGAYAPGSTVTSPLCQDPDYVYNWGEYDTFTMPSADTSIYGEKIAKTEPVITYTVTWYIDSSLIQTAQYESGTTVTSPVCEDSAYEYDWNGYDTFVMPSADTSIYGEKIAKTEPVITYTVKWYIGSSLIQTGEYAPGSTVTSPICQDEPDYVYDWNGYDTFTMPYNHFTIYGTKVAVDLSYVLSYYVDASVYTQQSYMANDAVDAPDDPQVEEGYSWSGWIDLPSLMPAYDSSVHSVLTANQYILDYYVDSSLWNSLIYNYKQSIVPLTYTPAEGYLFSGWVNEPETMPAINHYRVDGMTQLILYNVYWYIDSSLIQTGEYAPGSTVTSPVCEDSAYEYDWNGYDTFVMPSADTSIYGEKNIITYTVSWYIDSSLIQTGEYAPGTTVTSPLCQDPDYVYDWNGYDTFTMASADTSIYGTKESTQTTIDTSLFGISLEQYGTSVEHPVVDFGYIYNNNGANFIAAQSSGIPGYIYIQKPNTSLNNSFVMEEIDSSIPATFKYQISSDGVNWTDAVNVEFDTNVENKTTENNIVYLPELSSKVYVRLALKSIDTLTLTLNQITNGEYYSIMFGEILSDSKDTKSVFALDNKQKDSKYLVFGNYDAFYSRLTDLLNTIFNAQLKMHGLLLTIAYRICHAHRAYEHTAHNFITSGYRKWNAGFVINYPGSCSIETAPVILPTATDVYKYCYYERWSRCSKLTTPNNILPATTLAPECYQRMFGGCSSLTSAPGLPARTLAYECYYGMFAECTSLTSAPELPATNLASVSYATGCYEHMFNGCTALTSAPELPATDLASSCYSYMFWGCTALTSAPELPATNLAGSCYMFMFWGCTALTSITSELPALTVPAWGYYSMFYNCTSLEEPTIIRGTSYGDLSCCYMFYGCKSLLHRALLPASYDASTNAFKDMYGNTSLQD